MAPVVLAMQRDTQRFKPSVCVTGQHREMVDQVIQTFAMGVQHDLAVMLHDQTLAGLTAKVIERTDAVLLKAKPDIVLVQGDTTTALAAALAAFYRGVPVGHVEAGLRTGNLRDPFPEEANRIIIDDIAQYCFAPTAMNRDALLAERVDKERIFVTGNTGIDALLMTAAKVAGRRVSDWPGVWGSAVDCLQNDASTVVLITMHRRESFGHKLRGILESIRLTAREHRDVAFIYPVHLNPNVATPARVILGRSPNVHLIEPLAYEPFVYLMNRTSLIVTDSGGIQEEAPSLGKPVIVVRDRTERQEALAAGTITLGGTDPAKLVPLMNEALRSGPRAVSGENPYGDGHAASRILNHLAMELGRE
jgi:UDP-N-acetylglucosamine 2-epimerase (non-hydrolysing)